MAHIENVVSILKALKLPDEQFFHTSGRCITLKTKKKGWDDPIIIQFSLAELSSQCGGLLIHGLVQSGKVKKEVWLGILNAILTTAAFAILTDVVSTEKDKCFVFYKKLGTKGMVNGGRNPNTGHTVNTWVISKETIPLIKKSIAETAAKKKK